MKYDPRSPARVTDPWVWRLISHRNTAQYSWRRTLQLEDREVICRNTVFTLQSNLPGLCTYLISQRSTLPDDNPAFFFAGALCIGTSTASPERPHSNDWWGCVFPTKYCCLSEPGPTHAAKNNTTVKYPPNDFDLDRHGFEFVLFHFQAQAVSGRVRGPVVRTPTCGQWRMSCSISEISTQCWPHMLTFSENTYVFSRNGEDV